MKKRLLFWGALFLLGGLILCFLCAYYIFASPDYPEKWDSIKLGMTRSEVLTLLPDMNKDMKELKGYDFSTLKNSEGYRDGFWQILVYYYDNEKVKIIRYQYTDRNFGFLNENHIKRNQASIK